MGACTCEQVPGEAGQLSGLPKPVYSTVKRQLMGPDGGRNGTVAIWGVADYDACLFGMIGRRVVEF